jgi:hypothetical protein
MKPSETKFLGAAKKEISREFCSLWQANRFSSSIKCWNTKL